MISLFNLLPSIPPVTRSSNTAHFLSSGSEFQTQENKVALEFSLIFYTLMLPWDFGLEHFRIRVFKDTIFKRDFNFGPLFWLDLICIFWCSYLVPLNGIYPVSLDFSLPFFILIFFLFILFTLLYELYGHCSTM